MEHIQGKNYYEILGIDRDASVEEIKEAYRDIARVFHPDSHFFDEIADIPIKPEHEKLFKLVTLAYNTLVSESRRLDYDKQLPAALKGWEIPEEEVETEVRARPRIKRRRRPTGGNAWGRFGVVFDDYVSALGGSAAEEEGAVSLSQMIRSQRKEQQSWLFSVGLMSLGVIVLAAVFIGFL